MSNKDDLKSAAADIASGLAKLRCAIAQSGDNPRSRPKSERVIRIIESADADGLHWSTIASMLGANPVTVRSLLTRMVRRGDIERTGVPGMYRKKGRP